jgi:hypothetical protein
MADEPPTGLVAALTRLVPGLGLVEAAAEVVALPAWNTTKVLALCAAILAAACTQAIAETRQEIAGATLREAARAVRRTPNYPRSLAAYSRYKAAYEAWVQAMSPSPFPQVCFNPDDEEVDKPPLACLATLKIEDVRRLNLRLRMVKDKRDWELQVSREEAKRIEAEVEAERDQIAGLCWRVFEMDVQSMLTRDEADICMIVNERRYVRRVSGD